MRKQKAVFLFLMAILLVISIASCDTGSSSDTDDDTTALTIDQLVGTWEWQTTETEDGKGVTTITRTMTITKTGDNSATFTRSDVDVTDPEDDTEDDEFRYLEQEGQITLSATGILTLSLDREREADRPLTDSDTWDVIPDGEYDSFQIVILNSILYYGPFERAGTGTGITGTWERSGKNNHDGYTELFRETLEITDSSMTLTDEISADGTTWITEYEYGPGTYTRIGDVYTSDLFGETSSFTILQFGNRIIFGGMNTTSTTSFGWAKQ